MGLHRQHAREALQLRRRAIGERVRDGVVLEVESWHAVVGLLREARKVEEDAILLLVDTELFEGPCEQLQLLARRADVARAVPAVAHAHLPSSRQPA